ncbi:MAG: prenyltransferase [Pseudomonadota bacterium]
MLPEYLRRTAAYIADLQHNSGAIPWFADGIVDPWDHIEAAMGLNVAGYADEARAAYGWLAEHQEPNGAWFAAYRNHSVVDATRMETNFVAYVATGVWHHYLTTGDRTFLRQRWPMVEAALEFVLDLQADTGEIYWAVDRDKGVDEDALVTGCSSIYRSLACAQQACIALGESATAERYRHAGERLRTALLHRPERFDRTWPSKARYSMDWFYPVLTGVTTGAAAERRIDERWDEFVVAGLGCRCVSDEPWVTIAETCELVMALVAIGRTRHASELFENLRRFQTEDGGWWTGYVFRDEALWPEERPTWTAGAVLLAADALLEITPAARWFESVSENALNSRR